MMSVEESQEHNNDYYVTLGKRLKRKAEEFKNTVHLNSTNSPLGNDENSKRAFKMKLIHPKMIIARGKNKDVLEALGQKEGKLDFTLTL